MLTDGEKTIFIRRKRAIEMSKWKFILVYGLSFGLIMVIVSCAFDLVFDQISFSELYHKNFWHYIRSAPIAGLFFGLIVRRIYLWDYKYLGAKQDGPSA